ncbi:MAG TPA: cupin-like domain-containing protein, partial [Caulobacteraceae bacterium]
EGWPILAAARRGPDALCAYLLARDTGAPVPVMETPPAFEGRFGYAAGLADYSFSKRYRPLSEILARVARSVEAPAGAVIAIQKMSLADHAPMVARDNPAPLIAGDVAANLWLGGRVRTQTHHDPDHNLACVVAGRRRFLLFPPEQVGALYIGPPDRAPPLSLVDPEAPDLVAFPRFAEAMRVARVAHLGPGDALLIPRLWWHHVTSLDPFNAMINYWWGAAKAGFENPRDLFLAALLAIRRLPSHERDYWRAMFDAHAFADPGAAVAHLPSALRGHLGELGPGEQAALRRALRSAFQKSGA